MQEETQTTSPPVRPWAAQAQTEQSAATQEILDQTPADAYHPDDMAPHAESNYGVAPHIVAGAISWAKLTGHSLANKERFTHDEMQQLVDGFMGQTDVSHQAVLDAQRQD